MNQQSIFVETWKICSLWFYNLDYGDSHMCCSTNIWCRRRYCQPRAKTDHYIAICPLQKWSITRGVFSAHSDIQLLPYEQWQCIIIVHWQWTRKHWMLLRNSFGNSKTIWSYPQTQWATSFPNLFAGLIVFTLVHLYIDRSLLLFPMLKI